MTVELELAGHRYRATVSARARDAGSGAALKVVLVPLDPAGAPIERDLDVRATAHGYSIRETGSGRMVDVAVGPTAAPEFVLVQLPGLDIDVVVNGRRPAGAETPGAGGGEQRVVAPMPGRVLRVLVREGDAVLAGQALVVIEAMKMENALTAVRPGVVQEVSAVEGASVEAGRLLLRLR